MSAPGAGGCAGRSAVVPRGFTLIELVVVVAVLAILMGMLTSLLGISNRAAKVANTRALLAKVETGIRQFRTEMRVYPFQTDLSNATADPTQWTNNLGFRLAWAPSDSARVTYMTGVQADLNRIHAAFVWVDGRSIGMPNGDGTHAFRIYEPWWHVQAGDFSNIMLWPGSLTQPTVNLTTQNGGGQNAMPGSGDQAPQSQQLTKLAEEITCRSYLAGMMPLLAPQGIDPALPADAARYPGEDGRYGLISYTGWDAVSYVGYKYRPYNRNADARGAVLTGAAAVSQGWRAEYLAGSLRPSQFDPAGNVIIDAWGNPLVYICGMVPGGRGFLHGLGGGFVNELRYNLGPQSRATATSLAADARTTAAAGFENEFELWSCGPDGRFNEIRGDPANRDNLGLLPYNKGLQ